MDFKYILDHSFLKLEKSSTQYGLDRMMKIKKKNYDFLYVHLEEIITRNGVPAKAEEYAKQKRVQNHLLFLYNMRFRIIRFYKTF